MKKFAFAGAVAWMMAGLYVWGSQPARHFARSNQQTLYKTYENDTVPRKRDTLSRRDTIRRKDSLQ